MKKTKTLWPPQQAACVTALCLITVLLQGCANASQGSFCGIYQPVYTDLQDTEETRRAADANNAVWQAFCQ